MARATSSEGRRRTGRTVAAVAGGVALPVLISATHAVARIDLALFRIDPDLSDLFRMFAGMVGMAYGSALVLGLVATAIGFLARTLARARVRAGLPDPLAAARAFAAAPGAFLQLTTVPSLLWTALLAAFQYRMVADRSVYALLPGLLLPAVVVLLGNVALARAGLRALLSPTLDEAETEESFREDAEGFTFDAVAVTRETRGAVGAVALLSVAMAALTIALPVSRMRDPGFFAALLAYMVVAAGAAAAFRSASRISVGIDGVLVKGSSRTRFVGFRELDGARVNGGDLELMRGSRAVLRLQLHGKDAARRDALAERIGAAIARANAERDAPDVSFVQSATGAELAGAAQGASSYRRVAVSREQLWSVLEGPSLDTTARRAAAEALATSREPSERARFRVAAEQCADPAVRDRMHALLEEEDAGDGPAPVRRVLPPRSA
ncbi:MAG: hypothetical protein JWP97_622 [Labilithrix sp.]|nr:hypothetical protein [Labilithrix sp.]